MSIVVNITTITHVATNYNSDEIVFYNAAGEVTAIIIGVVLIIVGLSVILAIIFILKLKNDKRRCVTQSLKSQIR